MTERQFHLVGQLEGTEVGVQSTGDGQDILIRHSGIGQRLACLLASGDSDIVQQRDARYWRIVHDRSVDSVLVELIDLFISIRYAHPVFVQLELVMPEQSSTEGSESHRSGSGQNGL